MTKTPSQCPVCKGGLKVTQLECNNCHTIIENDFCFSAFEALSEEQAYFVLQFIKAEGSIKELERVLKISYPTVKSRLQEIKRALGLENQRLSNSEVLQRLSQGEITVDEALSLLKNNKENIL